MTHLTNASAINVATPSALSGADVAHSPAILNGDDMVACRTALNNGSRSFLAASHLLPPRMRDAATALYAFCREADDLIDLGDDPEAALQEVTDRINAVYQQNPQNHASDRALAVVVSAYHIPSEILHGLVEGFAWDTQSRRYNTLDDVYAYASRVAGTVGAMMSLLMGARAPDVVARACDLGIAMQLTNICRDVGEDARAGRCYLPKDWLREEGVNVEAWLENPQPLPGVRRVVARLLQQADVLYQRADAGIAELPRAYQRGIRVARLLYAAIGDVVKSNDFDSVSSRAVVPVSRKVILFAGALLQRSESIPELLQLAPLPANALWVETISETAVASSQRVVAVTSSRSTSIGNEVVAVLNLIERLERRRRFELQDNGKVPFVARAASGA